MSCAYWRVFSNGATSTVIPGARRMLENTSTIDLTLVDDNTSDEYPSNIEMLYRLYANLETLARFTPNIDLDQKFEVDSEVTDADCEFSKNPKISDMRSVTSLSFTATLAENGYILSILLRKDDNEGTPQGW
jgi:hypothetical protein